MKHVPLAIYIFMNLICLSGCAPTYSVILNHTEGTATDLVDENQTPTNHVKPNLSIPVSPL